MDQELVIRDAEPDRDEGLVFARYVIEITEGLFRSTLGPNAEGIMAAAYLQPDHDLSYKNTIFAVSRGTIVGMASGYTAAEHHGFSDKPLKEAAGRKAYRVAVFQFIFAAVFRALNTHDDGDFYLHYIGVSREARGLGIGTALLRAMEERAHDRGKVRFCLDVAAKNKGAIALYERFGLAVVSGWPRLPLVPKPVYRMAKPLT